MKKLAEILKSQNIQSTFDFTSSEYLQKQCRNYNSKIGNLNKIDGYNCENCKNKGDLWVVFNGEILTQKCPECTLIRQSIANINASGLDNLGFNNFFDVDDWQKALKQKGLDFVDNTKGEWLFIAGQSGCGKTHICTAVLRQLIFKYRIKIAVFKWQEDAKKLKQLSNDKEYSIMCEPFKTAKVLYIDDLFKCRRGEKPTPADINLAFEIIDYRYCHKLLTVISSEISLGEIIVFDEAIGGRIKQRTKDYAIYIQPDKNKNYRLK